MCEIFSGKNPGEFTPEILPSGWKNERVYYFSKGELKNRIEILDLKNQDLYRQEPKCCIALKMVGLFLAVNPFYFSIYSIIQIARIFIVPVVNQSSLLLGKELLHAVKLPFYFIALQFAAIVGMVHPLKGRALFGEIERSLHDGKGRREAEQYQQHSRPGQEVLWEALSVANPKTAFFVGFCMQPIGKPNDVHIDRLESVQNFRVV